MEDIGRPSTPKTSSKQEGGPEETYGLTQRTEWIEIRYRGFQPTQKSLVMNHMKSCLSGAVPFISPVSLFVHISAPQSNIFPMNESMKLGLFIKESKNLVN